MGNFAKQTLFGAVFLAAGVAQAMAADIYEPPIVEAPPPVIYDEPVDFGGWYIRGDLDYHASGWIGARYITYGPPPGSNTFTRGSLDSSFSLGGGVGYQASKYLRTDLTIDWMGKSNFRGSTTGICNGNVVCVSDDRSSYSALLLLANAYAEFGTWHGITPYLGAGIGGAYVKWDRLRNTNQDGTTIHGGASSWRFAYALMAGASYCLTNNLKLDVGYRYSRIGQGRMFHYANNGGPGFDRGFHIHEGRAGLRYQFGGANNCAEPEPYVPPVEPPVYK